ncbi:hypothetical protein ACWCP6_18350 [Streptomyces sp. NPDC002004]
MVPCEARVRNTENAIAADVHRCLRWISFETIPTEEENMAKHAAILRPRLDKVKPQDR